MNLVSEMSHQDAEKIAKKSAKPTHYMWASGSVDSIVRRQGKPVVFLFAEKMKLGSDLVSFVPNASNAEILAVVTSSLAAQLSITPERIDPDTKFSNLKPRPDDLDVVELLMTLEETFEIEITDAAIAKVVGSANVDQVASELTVRSLSRLIADTLR